jgi:hypothetical protein
MVAEIFFLALGIFVTWLAIKNRNFLLGVISSAIWLFIFYCDHNLYSIGNFVGGSAGDTFIDVILLGLAIATPIISWTFSRQEKKYNERDESEYQFKQSDRKAHKQPPTYSDITSTTNTINLQDMSDAEYLALLQNSSRKNKR